MAEKFHELVFTDSVRKVQAHYYGKSQRVEDAPERDALTEDEMASIGTVRNTSRRDIPPPKWKQRVLR